MHRAKPKAPLKEMEKKIPQNPRYKSTQSKIDSGNNVNKVRLISHKEYLNRRDETFRRLTPSCLAELLHEYEEQSGGGNANYSQPEMEAKMVKRSDGTHVMQRVPVEDNQGVLGSGGPRIVSYDADEKEDYDPPYLILDLRSVEDFAANRIYRSKSYPMSYINRDQLLPEMHRYKNKEARLIIVYDLDDKIVAQAAHTLVQRGFDNVFALSGGIVDFAEVYPEYVEGDKSSIPSVGVKKVGKSGAKEVYKPPHATTRSVAGSVRTSATNRTSASKVQDKKLTDASSVMSSLSVAETIISKSTARKNKTAHTALNYR